MDNCYDGIEIPEASFIAIIGSGVVFDAKHGGRFFVMYYAYNSSKLVLSNAALTNGHTYRFTNDCGAVVLYGIAELTACTFSGNTAGNTGGALSIGFAVVVKATMCVFSNNAARGNSDGSAGGAIPIGNFAPYIATLTLIKCTFWNNTATQDGGAIYAGGNSAVVVKGCHFMPPISRKSNGIYQDNVAR
jgi:predicted outer membrane repeat protein